MRCFFGFHGWVDIRRYDPDRERVCGRCLRWEYRFLLEGWTYLGRWYGKLGQARYLPPRGILE